MTTFLIVVLIIVCISLFIRVRKLEKTVEDIQKSLSMQGIRIDRLTETLRNVPPEEAATGHPEAAPRTPPPAEEKEKPTPPAGGQISQPLPREPLERPVERALREIRAAEPRNEPPEEAAPRGNETWARIERQFIENWTGIVGAVVMVMGVSFLGIYAALKLNPFHRFLMIIFFSGFLFASHLFLSRRSMWLRVAAWVRSSSGAIFLFACFGAHAIEGLKWIDNPGSAMTLLSLGIAVNLWFGFVGKTQVFASLHVILSLVALGIGPQSPSTLVITAVVAVIGVAMSYRGVWEYHLLLTISSFLAYQLFWYFSRDLSAATLTPGVRATGILVTAVTGVTACLVHYRKLYAARQFDPSAFMVHLLNWAYTATGLILYSTGSVWNTPVLGLTAIAAALLARYARKAGIRWLFTTDTLVAETIALFALFTLNRWRLDWFLITAIMYAEIFLFLTVMIKEKEDVLMRIGVALHYLSAGTVMIGGLAVLSRSGSPLASDLTILGAVIALEAVFHYYSVTRGDVPADRIDLDLRDRKYPLHFGGLVIPALLLIAIARIYHYPWAGAVMGTTGLLLFVWRQKIQSTGLAVGAIFFLVCAHIMCWRQMDALSFAGNIGKVALYGLPVFAVSLGSIFFSRVEGPKKFIRWPGIYMFTAHLAFFTYCAGTPLSPYLPGVVWITLSAVYLHLSIHLARRARAEDGDGAYRYVFHSGLAFVVLFFVAHIVVHMQPGPYAGIIPVRLLIEILTLIILFYWASATLPDTGTRDPFWRMHSLSWEVLAGFFVFAVAVEVPVKWHPLAWMISAFLFFVSGIAFSRELSRFRFYSLLFYWAACMHTAFMSGLEPVPSLKWADQAWVGAVAAMVLQFCYIVMFFKTDGLKAVSFPFPLEASGKVITGMQERRTAWVFYPSFIALAFFLFWTFDRSLLTVMWVLESFLIFVLSILLRENHFRYVSMAALTGALARLLFFDLARSATITRAVVFLSVGVIMLLMNILYNKYRGRFDR